jgi:hypothetical protein
MTMVDTIKLVMVQQVLAQTLQAAEHDYSASRTAINRRDRMRYVSRWRRHLDKATQLAAECALAEYALEDPSRVVLRSSGPRGSFGLPGSLHPSVPAQQAQGMWTSRYGVLKLSS